MKHTYLQLIVKKLLCFSLFCILTYGETPQPFIKKFKVEEGGRLRLTARNALVTIKTLDIEEIIVRVKWQAIDLNRLEAEKKFPKYTFTLINNELNIKSNVIDKKKFSSKMKIHFDIKAPINFNYAIKTSGGKVVIGDVNGDVEIETSGGRIGLYHVSGSVIGKTSGGMIHVESCKKQLDLVTSGELIYVGRVCGSATLKTSGGRITVEKAESDVMAKTSGGRIQIKFVKQPPKNCSLRTSGGSIEVKLAKNLHFNIYAKTTGGTVTTEIPLTGTEELGKTEIKTVYNNGGPLLELRTSGGNITLSKL